MDFVCVCVFLTTIGWISWAIFWGKKVDLSTRRLLLIRLWSWLEISQMLKKVDWFTYVNSSRTVNLHIFLLRLISSILANPGFLVYPHYFFVIFVFIWFMWCCIYLFLTSIYPITHFLGNEGPKTSNPSKYIRYIYNRVILENTTVRASAVSTLAKFGALVDSLKVELCWFQFVSWLNVAFWF